MSARHHQRRLRVERLEARTVPATFTVINTAASGAGSLSQAILDANGNAGADRIEFAIAPGGVQTIVGLPPEITDAVTIDGTTQPGFTGTPIVVLNFNFSPVGGGFRGGLELRDHEGSTLRGLVFQNAGRLMNSSLDFELDTAGVMIVGGRGHSILGCYVGTDVTGSEGRGNNKYGIYVLNSSDNRIGSPAPGDRNLISGNAFAGVIVQGLQDSALNNVIQGNFINTDTSGSRPIIFTTDYRFYRQFNGLEIGSRGDNTASAIVGGTAPGEGNLFADSKDGVRVFGTNIPTVAILGNSFRGVRNPIFLDVLDENPDTFLNDPLDADTGPNGLQNYPTIASIVRNAAGATIRGALASTPNSTFRIEIFRGGIDSPTAVFARRISRDGPGPAGEFLGSVDVSTDANGNATFSFNTSVALADTDIVSATATDLATNATSWVSPGRTAIEPWFAAGPDAGQSPEVKIFNRDGTLRMTVMAYESTFTGGVHVTMADMNDDNILDLITGPGNGGGPLVKVFDGRSGTLLRAFFAYDPAFRGGVNIAVGRLSGTGDFTNDIVTGAGVGGGPHVKFFNGATGAELAGFMAYDPAFRGGVNVALDNAVGTFAGRLVTAPGPGGGPHVKAYRPPAVFTGLNGQPPYLFFEFSAGPPEDRSGLSIALGEVDGDFDQELIIGPGAGRPPEVQIFDLFFEIAVPIRTIVAYDPAFLGGVRVTAADINFDGIADIVTAPGRGGGPHVRGFDGVTGENIYNAIVFDPAFTGGVFVG